MPGGGWRVTLLRTSPKPIRRARQGQHTEYLSVFFKRETELTPGEFCKQHGTGG